MNSNDIAIKAQNISKCYRIGLKENIHDSFGSAIIDFIKSPLNNFRKYRSLYKFDEVNPNLGPKISSPDLIWALNNVSFEVKKGEVLGIIGRNGAGKSTLLKILCKITHPTSGQAEILGRVSSLLEVGTGFHGELTGRENVYLNATILGMAKSEVDRKFDEIVDFSGIERFIDTPVKRYSSGMTVRLAFSVAAHLEPEILLIDEVLAVGDAAFQKKCLGKMDDVARKGRTILFVSHNMGAIRRICEKGILLDSGEVCFIGPAAECVEAYLGNGSETQSSILSHIDRQHAAVEVESIKINDSVYDQIDLPPSARELKIEIEGQIKQPIRMELEARIYDLYETPLAFFSPGHERGYTPLYQPGPFSLVRHLFLPRINRGEYYLSLDLTEPGIFGWVGIPRAAKIHAHGTSTKTGHVFDYNKGAGWVFLEEQTKGIE